MTWNSFPISTIYGGGHREGGDKGPRLLLLKVTPISLSKHHNKIIFDVVSARALYSASALERASTVSFLLLQEGGESPKKGQKPIVERRSVTSPALIPYFRFKR